MLTLDNHRDSLRPKSLIERQRDLLGESLLDL